MAADDLEALVEKLALLRDQQGRERVAEAERAIAGGDLTTRDEMAAIMAERERREGDSPTPTTRSRRALAGHHAGA